MEQSNHWFSRLKREYEEIDSYVESHSDVLQTYNVIIHCKDERFLTLQIPICIAMNDEALCVYIECKVKKFLDENKGGQDEKRTI